MKIMLVGVIGLLAGIIAAKTFVSREPDPPIAAPAQSYSTYIPAPIELPPDASMDEVRQAISATQAEFNALLEVERTRVTELAAQVNTLSARIERTEVTIAEPRDDQRRNRDSNEPRYDTQTFLDAGLSAIEADRILELEAEARSRAEELLASPEGRDREALQEILEDTSKQIRLELGDYGYETYLNATGRPTNVPVRAIEPESAGAVAGLQEDDQIISYAGQRVFDISDLQSLTQSGNEGDTVFVEVLRNEQPVILRMPRGQIGISTRNRR